MARHIFVLIIFLHSSRELSIHYYLFVGPVHWIQPWCVNIVKTNEKCAESWSQVGLLLRWIFFNRYFDNIRCLTLRIWAIRLEKLIIFVNSSTQTTYRNCIHCVTNQYLQFVDSFSDRNLLDDLIHWIVFLFHDPINLNAVAKMFVRHLSAANNHNWQHVFLNVMSAKIMIR